MGSGEAFKGIIDVVHMKARHLENGKPVVEDVPAEYADAAETARAQLTELVVEADDEVMMKYLEGEEVTQDELEGLLAKAIRERVFVPVFSGSCVREEGVISFMDAAVAWFPTMADFGRIPLVNGEQLDISEDDERPVVFAFKSLNDPQTAACPSSRSWPAPSRRASSSPTRARARPSAWATSTRCAAATPPTCSLPRRATSSWCPSSRP